MVLPVIPAGTDAPEFELPGLVDGERRRVALGEFLGEDVVILAFYPADFNPACDVDSDLDELDLFTMQKDVEVLAVGPDTLQPATRPSPTSTTCTFPSSPIPATTSPRHTASTSRTTSASDSPNERCSSSTTTA